MCTPFPAVLGRLYLLRRWRGAGQSASCSCIRLTADSDWTVIIENLAEKWRESAPGSDVIRAAAQNLSRKTVTSLGTKEKSPATQRKDPPAAVHGTLNSATSREKRAGRPLRLVLGLKMLQKNPLRLNRRIRRMCGPQTSELNGINAPLLTSARRRKNKKERLWPAHSSQTVAF
jgi:hypothetical protein